MVPRSSIYTSSLFDQTDPLSGGRFSGSPFGSTGLTIQDPHQGHVLHSAGQRSAIEGRQLLARQKYRSLADRSALMHKLMQEGKPHHLSSTIIADDNSPTITKPSSDQLITGHSLDGEPSYNHRLNSSPGVTGPTSTRVAANHTLDAKPQYDYKEDHSPSITGPSSGQTTVSYKPHVDPSHDHKEGSSPSITRPSSTRETVSYKPHVKPHNGHKEDGLPVVTGPFSTQIAASHTPDREQGYDYLIRNNGTINVRSTNNRFDRFYLEKSSRHIGSRTIREYKLEGVYMLVDMNRSRYKGSYNARLDDLNPYSTRKNLLGLTYPGGDNPKTFDEKADFTYVPDDLSEYPAIAHDRRYDRLGVRGLDGLLNDSRAIGADWKFVAEELSIGYAFGMHSSTGRNAYRLGVGLGVLALKKTILQFSKPNGMSEVLFWYRYSSIGVSYLPNRKGQNDK